MRNRLDIPAFKGIFVQAVADWTQATGKHTFLKFLHNQAAAVLDHAIVNRSDQPATCASVTGCRFSFIWSRQLGPGPIPIPITPASQESAIDALTAVLPEKVGSG
jgi:hypothetical protein